MYGLPVRPSFVKPIRPKVGCFAVLLLNWWLVASNLFKFSSSSFYYQDELRKELGLDLHLPAVLLMGGGEGMGPIEATARALGNSLYDETTGEPVGQVLVICGRNKKLANKLMSIDWKIPVQVLLYVHNTYADMFLLPALFFIEV